MHGHFCFHSSYTNKIRQALTELANIARRDGQAILARRLKVITHQLSGSAPRQQRFAKTA